jgi:hypothetical protein
MENSVGDGSYQLGGRGTDATGQRSKAGTGPQVDPHIGGIARERTPDAEFKCVDRTGSGDKGLS